MNRADGSSRILVALDSESAAKAVGSASALQPYVAGFAVGAALLGGAGPAVIGALARIGPVMADAKLFDVPFAAEAAARRLTTAGARWVTAHGLGGRAMLEAVVRGAAAGSGGAADVLVATALTSLDAAGLASVGLGNRPGRVVARLARLAAEAGAAGVVCSPRELGDVAQVAPGLQRVAAGIRPEGVDEGGHLRWGTPEEAVARGADLLLVGRPITAAPDPVEAAKTLVARLDG